jgi:dolichol-phosphate mannosyltransferase
VRCLVRIGRRGLSSACIERMLATAAPNLVMDAALQHDETLLPLMLRTIRRDDLDVIVASRFAAGGSVGEVTSRRLAISRLAAWLSRLALRADLSDPMSGFFIIQRKFFDDAVRRLSGQGFKILLDLSPRRGRSVLPSCPIDFVSATVARANWTFRSCSSTSRCWPTR